jgi:glycosyltransferase involved in cell wall biosynthesis
VKLSIVIPAYNEEDRIIHTLQASLSFLNTQDFHSEIIVVSDGSSDQTRSVVEGFNAGEKVDLRVIEYHPNRGKGYAVRTGMLAANGEMILFMDADYAVPIEEITKGIDRIDSGFDVAMGSRAVSGAVVADHQNFFRELSAKFYNLIQTAYLGIFYKDTQCGFKMFTKTAAKRLFSLQKLNSVIFDPEILWLAKKTGLRVAEFPVTWRHVGNSRIQYDSLKKSLFVFQELFRIRQLHGRFLLKD